LLIRSSIEPQLLQWTSSMLISDSPIGHDVAEAESRVLPMRYRLGGVITRKNVPRPEKDSEDYSTMN
jgi:hypothetical protein